MAIFTSYLQIYIFTSCFPICSGRRWQSHSSDQSQLPVRGDIRSNVEYSSPLKGSKPPVRGDGSVGNSNQEPPSSVISEILQFAHFYVNSNKKPPYSRGSLCTNQDMVLRNDGSV